MTTIAYKNGILAADKQTNLGPFPTRTTKVFRHGEWLAAGTGDTHRIREIHEWIEAGMDPKTLPAFQRDPDTSATFILVDQKGEIFLLDNSHTLVQVEQPFYAIGSGRDFAMMAMHLGKSAPEAVELAAIYDTSTGMGVDTVTIPQPLKTFYDRRASYPYAGDAMAGASIKSNSLLQHQFRNDGLSPLSRA